MAHYLLPDRQHSLSREDELPPETPSSQIGEIRRPDVHLYVFRHGETDWNVERRFQGRSDIPLNEVGRGQARALAESLAAKDLQIVLSSDLLRAKETGEIVATALSIPIVLDSGLREVNGGLAEGRLRSDLIQLYGEEHWQRWISVRLADMDWRFQHGESKRECLNRSKAAIETFIVKNQFQRLGISVHGAILRYLVHACLEDGTAPVAVHNCAVYELSFDLASRQWRTLGDYGAPASR